MFNLAEEVFDQMPFLIDMPVVLPGLVVVFAGRNHRRGTACAHCSHESVGVVALVCSHGTHGLVRQQRLYLRDVRRLPTGEHKVQRIAQGIGQRMDLGAEAASGAPQGFRRWGTFF